MVDRTLGPHKAIRQSFKFAQLPQICTRIEIDPVIVRFFRGMIVLVVFRDFAASASAGALPLCCGYPPSSARIGAMRREPLLTPCSIMDETVAYAALCCWSWG